MPSPKSKSTASPLFSKEEREALYQVIAARRDIRHFSPNSTVSPEVLLRVLAAAHQAPSVGLMQPWQFIRITEPTLRTGIAALVEQERQRTAEVFDDDTFNEQRDSFLSLKVEGINECAELIVVALTPDDGTVFGRRSMPREMAISSVACAIQNLWLASRAENLGMGWVSMFEPEALGKLLRLPKEAFTLAVLCLGPVDNFYPKPMLEQSGWRQGKPLDSFISENGWPKR